MRRKTVYQPIHPWNVWARSVCLGWPHVWFHTNRSFGACFTFHIRFEPKLKLTCAIVHNCAADISTFFFWNFSFEFRALMFQLEKRLIRWNKITTQFPESEIDVRTEYEICAMRASVLTQWLNRLNGFMCVFFFSFSQFGYSRSICAFYFRLLKFLD